MTPRMNPGFGQVARPSVGPEFNPKEKSWRFGGWGCGNPRSQLLPLCIHLHKDVEALKRSWLSLFEACCATFRRNLGMGTGLVSMRRIIEKGESDQSRLCACVKTKTRSRCLRCVAGAGAFSPEAVHRVTELEVLWTWDPG